MKEFKRQSLLIFSCLWTFMMVQPSFAQSNTEDIVGTWLTQKKDGKVEIFKQGNKYFGKITWLLEPNGKDGKPKIDNKNPEATR